MNGHDLWNLTQYNEMIMFHELWHLRIHHVIWTLAILKRIDYSDRSQWELNTLMIAEVNLSNITHAHSPVYLTYSCLWHLKNTWLSRLDLSEQVIYWKIFERTMSTRSQPTTLLQLFVNPFNAEATFIESTRRQRFLKTIQTLSCWYSLDSSQMSTHLLGFRSVFILDRPN